MKIKVTTSEAQLEAIERLLTELQDTFETAVLARDQVAQFRNVRINEEQPPLVSTATQIALRRNWSTLRAHWNNTLQPDRISPGS